MSYGCQYAVLRYLPYIETGEFINVGVVLLCPQSGQLKTKLLKKNLQRISHFFGPKERDVYKFSLAALEQELEVSARYITGLSVDKQRQAFIELARHRESVLRYSEIGAVLSQDSDQTLAELYEYYVNAKASPAKKSREYRLEKTLRGYLSKTPLKGAYKEDKVFDGYTDITLPFVNRGDDKISAIKPLALNHNVTKDLIIHGEIWISHTCRLLANSKLSSSNLHLLFAVQRPANTEPQDVQAAYSYVHRKLEDTGVGVADFNDTDSILDFATTSVNANAA